MVRLLPGSISRTADGGSHFILSDQVQPNRVATGGPGICLGVVWRPQRLLAWIRIFAPATESGIKGEMRVPGSGFAARHPSKDNAGHHEHVLEPVIRPCESTGSATFIAILALDQRTQTRRPCISSVPRSGRRAIGNSQRSGIQTESQRGCSKPTPHLQPQIQQRRESARHVDTQTFTTSSRRNPLTI